jgi:site-specific recombinase XerD
MARATFSITYYCRESKKNKQGLAPLELCININQQRLFVNLPTKLSPKEFNKRRRATYIEELVNQYRIKVNEVIAELMADGLPITATTLRDYLKTGGTKSKTIKDLFEEYLNTLKRKTTLPAYKKYELVRDFVYEHLNPTTQLSTIKNADMVNLYDILKEKYMISTAGGYFNKIKSIFTYAIDNGYMKINPFNGIKIEKGESKVEYLTPEEMDRVKNLDLQEYPRLERVRDLMLFQASVGTAYVDMVSMDINKIVKSGEVYTYSDKRHKTGIPFTTVILPDGMAILKKYNYTLPLLSNQKYNKYLKEIQRLAKITTVITSHLLRKTYATNLLNNGVRIEVVANLLGHSTTTITQKIYCKPTTQTIAQEVSKALNF